MFLNFLQEYSDYNLWAGCKLAGKLSELNEEQLTKEIKSSFPSIRKTVFHIMLAEDLWLQRLKDIKPTISLVDNPDLTTSEQINAWLKGSDVLREYVMELKESDLSRTHNVINSEGKTYTDIKWQMIAHCFNHSSYHKGQIVTMLRQLDISNIPNTGMIAYYRR